MKNLRIFSGLMAIFMFGFIYYVSSIQFPPPPPGVSFNGKAIIYHISVFFLLSMFLYISMAKKELDGRIFSIMSISLVYAMLDELHQYFVPGRFMSVNDVLIDSIGITFSTLIYFIIIEVKKKNILNLWNL